MAGLSILHVVPDLRQQAGGIAATVPALAEALRAEGIDNHFLTLAHDAGFQGQAQTTCARLDDVRNPVHLKRLAAKALSRLPAETVLHNHGLWSVLNHVALRTAVQAKRPTVLSIHGMLLPWARQHKKLRKDVAWALYQRRDLLRADRLHVTSHEEEKIVGEISSAAVVMKIPFGVDLPVVAPPIAGTDRTLLFLGRLHPVKNLEALICAFAAIAPTGWKLRLAGPDEGGYRAKLEDLIETLGAGQYVSFAGPVYGIEKTREMVAAQALVLPSFTENFGAVVAEALAMGRPVIATRGTPWQELEEVECGWWVSPDRESLARAIVELTRHSPTTLANMGAQGRDLVKRVYSWKRVATDMAQLYTSIV
jgi:glycosyltransferase involved in cell wall biosynthesis